MQNTYLTPSRPGKSEITEKRSRFIGNMIHINSEDEALEFIKSIKKEYYDAKHSAYAYITGSVKRYSDDGEPAKTAGLPILDMLDAQKITDCVCVVTRYFGGVLLGTGGLVRAYTQAAKLALEDSSIKKMTLHSKYQLTVPYSLFDNVKYVCTEAGCEFIDCSYTDVVNVICLCETEKCEDLEKALEGAFSNNIKLNFLEHIYS